MSVLFIPLRMYSQAAPRNSRGVACEYIRRGMKSRPNEKIVPTFATFSPGLSNDATTTVLPVYCKWGIIRKPRREYHKAGHYPTIMLRCPLYTTRMYRDRQQCIYTLGHGQSRAAIINGF